MESPQYLCPMPVCFRLWEVQFQKNLQSVCSLHSTIDLGYLLIGPRAGKLCLLFLLLSLFLLGDTERNKQKETFPMLTWIFPFLLTENKHDPFGCFAQLPLFAHSLFVTWNLYQAPNVSPFLYCSVILSTSKMSPEYFFLNVHLVILLLSVFFLKNKQKPFIGFSFLQAIIKILCLGSWDLSWFPE